MKNSKLLYGVAINDSDYPISKHNDNKKIIWMCPYYTKWRSMLQRCYDTSKNPFLVTYKDAVMTEEWHRFSNFKEWMVSQNPPMNYQLDKDIIKPHNKVYGPDTCLFVSQQLNLFFNRSDKTRGKYPIGVCYVNRGKKRMYASITIEGKSKSVGYYYTPEEAYHAYLRAKKDDLYKRFILPETDQKLKTHLLNVYNNIEEYFK